MITEKHREQQAKQNEDKEKDKTKINTVNFFDHHEPRHKKRKRQTNITIV